MLLAKECLAGSNKITQPPEQIVGVTSLFFALADFDIVADPEAKLCC